MLHRLFNAFEKSDFDKKGKYFLERFISAHAIMLSFEGIPAVYFNSIFGTSNDNSKYIISGNKRDLNRYRWNKVRLEKSLKNKNSKQTIYYRNMINLLKVNCLFGIFIFQRFFQSHFIPTISVKVSLVTRYNVLAIVI